ncbi:MAG: DUF1080 domain-containing protein [Gammaproteobacteria bacterium]|jgi:hypothetical protein|nr:DUF1080 domain-containing protein [Gammaproteobacteria bacterium]
MKKLFLGASVGAALLTQVVFAQQEQEWEPLFNGVDLSNWDVKFTGFELGDNYRNTFRVEDGILRVAYDDWPTFDGEFGHLFTKEAYSHYRLRVEYRFVGDQVTDGPAWAYRNNGMMLHSQSAQSMGLDQEFPASIEAQMLGGNGEDERPNGNVCTPGTHIEIAGELVTRHCTNSESATFHGDDWITLEIEVRGAESVTHFIEGEKVFAYGGIQLDPDSIEATPLIAAGAPLRLDAGHIAIQAETAPIEFRRIELKRL